MSDHTHWTPESEIPPPLPPLAVVPPPPRVPELADTEPPGPPDGWRPSMAPEALEEVLARLVAAVDLAAKASEGARAAAVTTADALAEHVAAEREWQASVERRLDVLARSSLVLPVVGVVLGGIALLLALLSLLVAVNGGGAAAAPPSVGAGFLGALGAALGVGRG